MTSTVSSRRWRSYFSRPTAAKRRNLLAACEPMVEERAQRLAASFCSGADYPSAYQAGIEALMYAVDHFDMRRGVPFPAYLSTVIKQHILDSLRYEDSFKRCAHITLSFVPPESLEEKVDPSSLDGFAAVDVEEDVRASLRCLSPPHARLMRSRLQGQSYAEIARRRKRDKSLVTKIFTYEIVPPMRMFLRKGGYVV